MAVAIDPQLSLSSKQSRLDTLVDDVLIHVLSLLPVWDVLHVRQTSKRMEVLSHVCAVWRALFARDVVTSGRPIPGFSFTPTPRLLQLCALDPTDLDHIDLQDTEKCDIVRQLVEASDLEARTLCAVRLEKSWKASASTPTSVPYPGILKNAATDETRLRAFQTPTPVRDLALLPGGRFVVSLHADRLRCWDLGGPHALNSTKSYSSPAAGVKCVGELVLASSLSEATLCMDTRASSPAASVYGRHTATSISFALCPDILPSWNAGASTRRKTCEILSVSLDPLRSDLHGTASGPVSLAGSPVASPVPFFRHEAVVRLPEVLIMPSYPEGSVSAQTMVGPQWGPQRFARGKLGKLLLVYGSVMFFESFVPPAPADGDEESGPKYVGIEVLDWNEPSNTVLLEYPDPQVGPYVGMHVHSSANQVLVVWQNCAGLYPLPFRNSFSSSTSSLSLSGSTSGLSSVASSRPSTPSRYSDASRLPRPDTSFSSPSSPSPLCSSPGSFRSTLDRGVSDVYASPSGTLVDDEDVKVDVLNSDSNAYFVREPGPEPKRMVTAPTIVFALSEPVEAPIAFSLCSGSEVTEKNSSETVPHALTLVARSCTHPSTKVQSVLTASENPYPENEDDKFTFRLSRIPSSLTEASPPSDGADNIAALAIGRSGRGIFADARGALFRCMRAEVVMPGYGFQNGYGFYEFDGAGRSIAVPTVDFSWNCAAVLPATAIASSSQSEVGETEDSKLVLRFDEGMGRVVAVRALQLTAVPGRGTSEVTVLDFA